jgi:hypothetical protein
MIWRWRYFVGASILIGALLINRGVPPLPVVAGIVGVAMFMRRQASKLS